jgi:hypothetical protein
MNVSAKMCLLTMGLAAAFASVNAPAAVVAYGSAANAPARCQAFTPGPSNTVRNRVIGSENIGAAAIAVACAFEAEFSQTSTDALGVEMYFSYNAASGSASVPCTLLNGWQGAPGQIAVNKTVTVTTTAQGELTFGPADTPDTTDTDLGFVLVGVNCTLPQNVVINDTYVFWGDENGA